DTTRALALAVDAEIRSVKATLQTLAESNDLQDGRLARFHREAQAVAARHEGWVVLTDAGGQQRVNTRRAFGDPLPKTGTPELIQTIVRTRQPVVTDLVFGIVAQRYLVAVMVPVVREGVVRYALELAFGPERLTRLLAAHRFPASWITAITDGRQRVVARVPAGDRQGQPVLPPQARAFAGQESGAIEATLTDGRVGRIAFQRLREVPWAVDMTVPVSELQAAWRRPVLALLLLGGLAALGAVGLALGLARKIVRPVTEAARLAAAVVQGQTPTLPASRIAEVADLQDALADGAATVRTAIRERERAAAALREANEALEARVVERTAALGAANAELQTHQIELEMQNEELRRSQGELDAAQARYFDLYDLAPVGYLTLDETNLIQQANLTAATLLRVDRQALLGQPLTRFLIPEDQDRYYLYRRQLVAMQAPRPCEVRLGQPDGAPPIWVRLDANVAPAEPDIPQRCRVVLSDITERKRAEKQLQATLAEKEAALASNETLLREVHHRTKNNLQMICSLLELQAEAIASPEGKDALELSTGRIYAIARLYEQLYRTMSSGQVVLCDYLAGLAEMLKTSHGTGAITFHLPTRQGIWLDVDRAIQCGLILNELYTNALKHAFPAGTAGEIGVDVQPVGDRIQLRVWDNGRGLPVGMDIERSTSLGLRLVRILAQRLRADIKIEHSKGTAFTLTFPLQADPPLEPKVDSA
ncbi:MAG TPA: histidine kinase dimerization/phosphoacceptor domain -containing protein, partial [Candidatus Sulfotelmatobacter sp.]|nr:histidine kinase dimerization/phosphoacceptor domain -containing protein [Candidatus Sulfotelmatobacter sp.]